VSGFSSFHRPFPFLRGGLRNDASRRILTPHARLIEKDGRYLWRVVRCPQCGAQHEHDAGAIGIDNPRRLMPWYVKMPCATAKSQFEYYRLEELPAGL